MTPRSLFNIVLKIIGVLFIKDIVDAITQLFFSVAGMVQEFSLANLWGLIFVLIPLGIYYLVAYYFIFKTDVLMDKLKLIEGFSQENFPLNIHRSTVLSIAIIIIGGLLIADNIPLLCRSVYLFFQSKSVSNALFKKPDYSYMIIYSVKILVGLILTGNHQLIVNYIERKRKGNIIATEPEVNNNLI